MSAEQSPAGENPVDITERATNPAPKPREKNPKRVAAGKLVAERTRIARQQQKKAAAEASVIIANNNAKQPPPPPDPAPEKNSPFTLTQGLMVASIFVGVVGIYYKREELKVMTKTFFGEKKKPEPDTAPAVGVNPHTPLLPFPSVELAPTPQPKPKFFSMMD